MVEFNEAFAHRTRNARAIGFGNSHITQGFQSDASNIKALARGALNRIAARTGRRIRFNPDLYSNGGDAFAAFGQTTSYMVANGIHTAAVTSHAANNYANPIAFAFMRPSINDRSDGQLLSYNTTIGNLTTIRNALDGEGIPMIWSEAPASDAGTHNNWVANGQLAIHHEVLSWMRSRHGLPGEYYADTFSRLVDPTSTVAAFAAALSPDALHPNQLCADAEADLLIPIVDQILPPNPLGFLPSSAADLFGANHPSGVLNANPFMTGVDGTVAGTGVSGVLPTGFVSSSAGSGTMTCVFSKYTHTDGSVWVKAILGGTPAAAVSVLVTLPNLSASIASADVIDGVMETMVDASQVGLNQFGMSLFDGGASGGAKSRQDQGRNAATDLYWSPAVQRREIQRIPRFAIATAGSLTPTISINMLATAVTATVYFRAVGIYKNLGFNF